MPMRSISTLSFESYRKTFLSKTSPGNSSKGAARNLIITATVWRVSAKLTKPKRLQIEP